MKIIKYAQSCFLLSYKGITILIDPGSYCYAQGFTPAEWPKVDVVLLTHSHQDHTWPEAIQVIDRKSRPLVLTNQEVARTLSEYAIHAEVLKPKYRMTVKGVTITGVWQVHGEPPNRMPKPEVIGFLVDDAFYHPGDTMATDNPPHADVVAVPICGQVTMDPYEAAGWVKLIKPRFTIPMHYHNPKFITDPQLFVQAMGDSEIVTKVLSDGKSLAVE